jgi:hypothetical protein
VPCPPHSTSSKFSFKALALPANRAYTPTVSPMKTTVMSSTCRANSTYSQAALGVLEASVPAGPSALSVPLARLALWEASADLGVPSDLFVASRALDLLSFI